MKNEFHKRLSMSQNIFEESFKSIEDMKSRKLDSQELKAISNCLKQANRAMTNQIELAKAKHKGIDIGIAEASKISDVPE